jgi:hypothetical protein
MCIILADDQARPTVYVMYICMSLVGLAAKVCSRNQDEMVLVLFPILRYQKVEQRAVEVLCYDPIYSLHLQANG